MDHSFTSSSQMYLLLVIFAFLLLCIHPSYEQEREIHGGSFEVREHSLNRPYPSGLTILSL